MDNFGKAIAAINELKGEGIVSDYALGGAIALIFWSEPVATSARTRKRLQRVEALLEEGNIDEPLLMSILKRFKLRLPRENR
ncbi:MAG TPA: hypothetical protein VF381_07750 [Thermoanaerobaculia bacterium]